MDDLIKALAANNGGYLHRADLLEHGVSDRGITRAVSRGELRRVRVGTYVFADEHDLLTPEEQHVVLARSVIDKFPAGSVALSHHSAAAAHGLALFDVDRATVHLTRLDGGAGRFEAGVVHHSRVPSQTDLVRLDERLVVSAGRAAWETACSGSTRAGLVVMDSALNQRLLAPEQLGELGQRFRQWPGSRAARLMARLADPGAETPGESLMRFACFESSVPRPDTQVEVYDEDGGFVGRTDLGWELFCHLAEFDGFRKYWRDRRPGEDASAVVVREKVREDKIRSLGRGLSRAIWPEVLPSGSRLLGARLRHELERSHSLYAKGRRVIV